MSHFNFYKKNVFNPENNFRFLFWNFEWKLIFAVKIQGKNNFYFGIFEKTDFFKDESAITKKKLWIYSDFFNAENSRFRFLLWNFQLISGLRWKLFFFQLIFKGFSKKMDFLHLIFFSEKLIICARFLRIFFS